MKDMGTGNNRSMSKGKIQAILKVSIAIGIGLVILIVGISLWSTPVDTKMTKAEFQIKYFQNALEQYHKDYDRYPTTEEGVILLTKQEDPDGNMYLIRLLDDPWGNPYNYVSPGIHNTGQYDLWTYGADNAPGGKDYNRDITNWGNRE